MLTNGKIHYILFLVGTFIELNTAHNTTIYASSAVSVLML